jgi:hypothetical protein
VLEFLAHSHNKLVAIVATSLTWMWLLRFSLGCEMNVFNKHRKQTDTEKKTSWDIIYFRSFCNSTHSLTRQLPNYNHPYLTSQTSYIKSNQQPHKKTQEIVQPSQPKPIFYGPVTFFLLRIIFKKITPLTPHSA